MIYCHNLYAFRYLAQKKYNETLNMLYEGSILFLDRDQVFSLQFTWRFDEITVFFQTVSGADLAILLVECLVKSEATNYLEWIPKLCKIFSKIPPSTPERETFLTNAIRWSSNDGQHGHPFLHQVGA